MPSVLLTRMIFQSRVGTNSNKVVCELKNPGFIGTPDFFYVKNLSIIPPLAGTVTLMLQLG